MVLGKVQYIHIRRLDDEGNSIPSGGATVAWKLDADFNVVVSQPAYCSPKDLYVKLTGREIASGNLQYKDALGTLPNAAIKKSALEEFALRVQSFQINEQLKTAMINAFSGTLEQNGVDVVLNNSWFEGQVREFLRINLYSKLVANAADWYDI